MLPLPYALLALLSSCRTIDVGANTVCGFMDAPPWGSSQEDCVHEPFFRQFRRYSVGEPLSITLLCAPTVTIAMLINVLTQLQHNS